MNEYIFMSIFIKSVLGRYLNLASTLAFQNESSLQSFIFSLTKEHPVSLIKTPYPLYRFKNIKRTCFKTENRYFISMQTYITSLLCTFTVKLNKTGS